MTKAWATPVKAEIKSRVQLTTASNCVQAHSLCDHLGREILSLSHTYLVRCLGCKSYEQLELLLDGYDVQLQRCVVEYQELRRRRLSVEATAEERKYPK